MTGREVKGRIAGIEETALMSLAYLMETIRRTDFMEVSEGVGNEMIQLTAAPTKTSVSRQDEEQAKRE